MKFGLTFVGGLLVTGRRVRLRQRWSSKLACGIFVPAHAALTTCTALRLLATSPSWSAHRGDLLNYGLTFCFLGCFSASWYCGLDRWWSHRSGQARLSSSLRLLIKILSRLLSACRRALTFHLRHFYLQCGPTWVFLLLKLLRLHRLISCTVLLMFLLFHLILSILFP